MKPDFRDMNTQYAAPAAYQRPSEAGISGRDRCFLFRGRPDGYFKANEPEVPVLLYATGSALDTPQSPTASAIVSASTETSSDKAGLLDDAGSPRNPVYALHTKVAMRTKVFIGLTMASLKVFLIWAQLSNFFHLSLSVAARLLFKEDGPMQFEDKFSIWSSCVQMWRMGRWDLALIMTLYAFIWPHLKLYLTMIAFFAPLTESRRDTLLRWVACLGPLALIEHQLCIVLVETFQLSSDGGALRGYVEIMDGMYLFVTGMIACILFSNMMLAIHRYHISPGSKSWMSALVDREGSEMELPRALFKDVWRWLLGPSWGRVVATLVPCIIFLAAGAVLLGVNLPALAGTFHTHFVRGDFSNTKHFSVIDGGNHLVQHGDSRGWLVGDAYVGGAHIIMCSVLPLAWLVGLATLWFAPIATAAQWASFQLWIEMISFASTLHVMVLVMLALRLCLKNYFLDVVRHRLGGTCDEVLPGVDVRHCLYFDITLEAGFYFCMFSVVLMEIATYLVKWLHHLRLARLALGSDQGKPGMSHLVTHVATRKTVLHSA